MSMSAPEARAELKKLYTAADTIEQKYPDGPITNNEDMAEVKRLLSQVDDLEAQLATLDEAAQRKARITGRLGDLSKPVRPDLGAQGLPPGGGGILSPGAQFIASQDYLSAKDRGLFNSDTSRLEFTVPLPQGEQLVRWSKSAVNGQTKALVYGGSASGGALVIPDYQPGVTQLLQRPIVVSDLIPHLTTTAEVISYVLETSGSAWNNAGTVAEATATTGTSGTKPESALSYSTQTTNVRTIAHWVPVTNRQLADAPQIRGLIDTRLLLGLDQVLEQQVLTGNGTGENLLGILNTPGILTQAAGTSILDALWNARQQVRVTGLANPNAVVMHPTNFSAVRLAKATTNEYLYGPPSVTGPTTVWGMPVAESLFITLGTAIVGDFQMGSVLFDREQGAIKVGYVNDQFIRNITTLLAELRAAFATLRPSAYCQVTGAP